MNKTLRFFLWAVATVLATPLAAQNPYKAPLYWSVYENNFLKNQQGISDNYITETELQANIDWVDQNLKLYGFNTICMDGWGDVSQLSVNGYRTSHSRNWAHNYVWWATYLQSKTMRLGMYDNPLWVHVSPTDTVTKVVGTSIRVSSLINTSENALWFKWVQVNRAGAEEYVKGYIKHYANMGIKFLRVDFLSWFETGTDKNLGTVGVNRPRADYEKALRWLREACDSSGIMLSLVMPNLKNEAAAEKKYGHMIRINQDVGTGGWARFSDLNKGTRYAGWSQYENPCDGYGYWSSISGRDSVILDGDFIRLNTFKTDIEKRSVISMHIMAGGPLSIADQYNTIGNDIWLYQNPELLLLNTDKFVGKPLTNNPLDERSQIWTGKTSTGDWIIGLFNRGDSTRTRSIAFSTLGLTGTMKVRDLWQHGDLGGMKELTADIPPHGCLIVKLTSVTSSCSPQAITFNQIADKPNNTPDFAPTANSLTGQPLEFEIATGPATIINNKVHLTGANGTVYVQAKQQVTSNHCVAFPKIQSFEVINPRPTAIYVGGTFNNWALANNPMTFTNNMWSAKNVAMTQGNHEMKFANTPNFTGIDWGNATGLFGTAKITTGGAPNLKFTVPTTGNYDIFFNDLNLAYLITNSLTTTKTADEAAENLRIYPNPAQDLLTIQADEIIEKINLMDMAGRKIVAKSVNAPTIQLDISFLPKGVYMLQIFKENSVYLRKVVVQ
jgi:hypothetical protein